MKRFTLLLILGMAGCAFAQEGLHIKQLRQLAIKRHLWFAIRCNPDWHDETRSTPGDDDYENEFEVWVSPAPLSKMIDYIEEGGKGFTLEFGHTQDEAALAIVEYLDSHDEMKVHAKHMPGESRRKQHRQCPPEISGGPQ